MDSSYLLIRKVWQSALGVLQVGFAVVLITGHGVAATRARRPAYPGAANVAADPALVAEREHLLNSSPLAMFYYLDDSPGLTSLQAHTDAITLLAPQCFDLDRAGRLHGQIPPRALELARREGLSVMPLVKNSGFDRRKAHALLHSARAQERAAAQLAQIAERDQCVGWQLDFEDIDPADKLAYTRFAARVAARLHRSRRLLSVAVVPRFSDRFPDSYKPGFHTSQWGAAYDYRGLARAADFLVLMAYDQHTPLTPPGPVAAYDWTKAALDYAVRRVPPSKLLLGLPFYGREWAESSGGTSVHSLAYKDLKPYLDDPDAEQHWDNVVRTTWFQLRDGTSIRTAWFDDARSLKAKLALVSLYHLRGYAAWRLGTEDPEFWQLGHEQNVSGTPERAGN